MTQSYSPVTFTDIAIGAAANASTFNDPLTQLKTGLAGSQDIAPRQMVISLVTGESITLGNLVRLSGGLVYKADNGSVAGVTNVIGVALETKSTSNAIKVAIIKVVGFTGLTLGAIQYVGSSGAITETPPSSNQMPIGIATSTTDILMMRPQPGELVEVTKTTSTTGSTTLGTYTDAGHSTFTLSPGVWTIFGSGTISISGATGTGVTGVISVLSLTDNSNNILQQSCGGLSNAEQTYTYSTLTIQYNVTVTSSTTYKLRFCGFANSGSPTISDCSMYATAELPIKLFAIRRY